MLILLLGLSHTFVLRSALNSNPSTICIMKQAFDSLSSVSYIDSITVHATSNEMSGPVKVAAHVTCCNGNELWGHGDGDGILRACQDCATDTLIKMTLYTHLFKIENP